MPRMSQLVLLNFLAKGAYCISMVETSAPSATILQPFATSCLASSGRSSFWVAQGSAMSHGIVQMPRQRQLHQDPVNGGIRVQPVNLRLQRFLGR